MHIHIHTHIYGYVHVHIHTTTLETRCNRLRTSFRFGASRIKFLCVHLCPVHKPDLPVAAFAQAQAHNDHIGVVE